MWNFPYFQVKLLDLGCWNVKIYSIWSKFPWKIELNGVLLILGDKQKHG
jgi:hypothetical protein